MSILHSSTAKSSLRALLIHCGMLYLAYVVVLAIYFFRLPASPGVGLVLGLLGAGALELLVMFCAAGWLLGAGPLREHRWRAVLYAVVLLVFTLIWLAQGDALLISNAFISPVALENVQDAALSASLEQNLLLAVGALACGFTLLFSWRGSSRWMEHGGGCGGMFLAMLATVAVAALNLHASVDSGNASLAAWQSPVASLLRSGLAVRQMDQGTAIVSSQHTGEELCGVPLSSGAFPFLKNTVNDRPLPFPSSGAPKQPNVIVLFMEGESARLFEAYGGRFPDLTPNFSRIARESMVVDNYFNHTAPTYRGLQGQLTSGYPLRGGAENGVGWADGDSASRLATHHYASLPGVLRDRGYQTVFFSPHPSSEALTPFAHMLGFEQVYTAQQSLAELLEEHDPLFKDALTDRDSYRALTAYMEGYHQQKPFLIGLYSLDTHAFLDIPPSGIPYGDGSNPDLNTLHTLDARIGAFYDYLKASKYADNTVLVLTADHAHYAEPPYLKVAGANYKPYFVDRIPLLIHAPWLKLPPRLDVHGRTSLDLTPTILQILGIDRVPNSFVGHSLFERSHDRAFSIAAIGQAIYAIQHGEVFGPDEIPAAIQPIYTKCTALVETYYAQESADKIFPAATSLADGQQPMVATDGTPQRIDPAVLAAATPTQTCAFDSLDGEQLETGVPKVIGREVSFVAHGWLTGRNLQSPRPFAFVLRGSQDWVFAAQTGLERPDVAAALHAPTAGHAGFNMVVDPRKVPAGPYQVLGLIGQGQGAELCDMHRQLTIGGLGAP